MRLLIFIGIVYLCYRFLKSLIFQNLPAPKAESHQNDGQIDDIMVKDPVCEVFFPRREGVALKADGQELFFCSEKCRDEFVARRSNA